ncbi:hypothetical protein FACS1894110_15790 [Spirochaetia bacterium]|nr:hypothetical protein FACS1894110_15790 [Spirochaetia bacterium]
MRYNKIIIALFVFAIHHAMAQEDEYVVRTTEYKNGIGDIIYYTQEGDYTKIWIYENNEKRILGEYMDPDYPTITWHDEHLVAIGLFGHNRSRFFDFTDSTISSIYYEPVFVDIKNKYVIVLAEDGLDVYNIKTNEIVQKFRKKRLFEGVQSFHFFYFRYKVSLISNRLLFSYDYYTNDKKTHKIHKMVEFKYNY